MGCFMLTSQIIYTVIYMYYIYIVYQIHHFWEFSLEISHFATRTNFLQLFINKVYVSSVMLIGGNYPHGIHVVHTLLYSIYLVNWLYIYTVIM